MGGGDLSRGEIGQRGVSLSSEEVRVFSGAGAFTDRSEGTGWSTGVEAADKALCVAAAEGGFVLVLEAREGLISCALFFLDRPGPVERAEEELFFNGGLTGETSLEIDGEFVVDVARLGRVFFVVDAGAVDESPDFEAASFWLLSGCCSAAGSSVRSAAPVKMGGGMRSSIAVEDRGCRLYWGRRSAAVAAVL